MKIAILFTNIGSYHAARLRAASEAFSTRGWELMAMQVSSNTFEHPWGDLSQEINFPVETIMSEAKASVRFGRREWSKVRTALVERLDRIQPEAVFVPGWGFPAARAVLKWCKNESRPAILMSESKKNDTRRSYIREAIKARFFVKRFSSALVGGQAHKEYLVSLGMTETKVFMGYDVVDNEYFIRSAERLKNDSDATRDRSSSLTCRAYFLSIARMMPRKNLLGLIAAYESYRGQVGSNAYDLMICGSGEQEDEIRAAITRKQMDEFVHLPGFVSYSELPAIFSRAAALIHPALQEQWGLVVNEACASGLPVLCSRTVGAAELVREGQNGFLFDPTSVENMTAAMLDFHCLEEEARAKMGQSSRIIVSSHGPEMFGRGAVAAVDAAFGFNA